MTRLGHWLRGRLSAPLAETMAGAMLRALDTRPDETVLEIGCGAGGMVRRLLAEGHVRKIAAIDASPAKVEAARRLNRDAVRDRALDIREASVSDLPFRDGQFDLVFAIGGVAGWHLRGDLEEILRVLKPGGRVLLGMRVLPGGRARRKIELVLRSLPPAGFVEVTVEEIRRWGLRLLVIGAKRPIWSGGPYDAFVA